MSRLLGVACVLFIAAWASAQDLVLAARGQPPACTLVRPAASSSSQVYATEELQRFAEQMTGVRLPITTDDQPLPARAVLLGDTQVPDEFYARAALLWQQAEAAVKDSPAHLYNVRMGEVPVLNARLLRQPRQDEIKVWVTADPALKALSIDKLELIRED